MGTALSRRQAATLTERNNRQASQGGMALTDPRALLLRLLLMQQAMRAQGGARGGDSD